MSFVARSLPPSDRDEGLPVPGRPVASQPARAAGDPYFAALVQLIGIAEKHKLQSIAIEHARKSCTRRDEGALRLALSLIRVNADDIRKLTLAADEKIAGPDMDDASNVYGDGHA